MRSRQWDCRKRRRYATYCRYKRTHRVRAGRGSAVVRQGLTGQLRSALQGLALWLGVIALTLQSFAPLCLAAAGGSAPPGGYSIVICTAHGFEKLVIGADGAPVKGTPATPDQSCSLCIGMHSQSGCAAPDLVSLAQPAIAVAASLPDEPTPASSLRPHSSYVSRAPPISA